MKPNSPLPDAPIPERVLIVGTGGMAAEYAKALRHFGLAPDAIGVLGRDRDKTAAFAAAQGGLVPLAGGFAAHDHRAFPADAAIVAVPPTKLADAAERLMDDGVARILVEKPGAMSAARLERVKTRAEACGAKVALACNRRFFPSVVATRDAIAADGGLLAANFDITELESRTVSDPVVTGWGAAALERLGVVNSIHVLDLFAHLAGLPAEWNHHRRGSLPWHPSGAMFWGSGVTGRNVAFTYLSCWNSAGRWGVELMTPARKIILRPLETAIAQAATGFQTAPLAQEQEPAELKPGLAGMLRAFLAGGPGAEHLCSLDQAVPLLRWAETVFGYEA